MLRILIFSFIGVVSLCVVRPAFAAIVINEIAWMGTEISANDEWIELHNDGSSSVSLSGWKLSASDGAPNIALSGSIEAGEYFLLERTDDDTILNVQADQIFSGAIGNTGEHFKLLDASGVVVDEVNQAGAWTAGDNATKNTMQRKGNSWITAEPTPRAVNHTTDIPSITGSQGSEDTEEDEGDEEVQAPSPSKSSTSKNSYDEDKKKNITYAIETSVDPIIIAGIPAQFKILVSKDGARQFQGIHAWNFGDGSSLVKDDYRRRDDFTIEHVYEYPGTYAVTFEYYSSTLQPEPQISHRISIEVIDPKLAITAIAPGAYIELSTEAEKEIDISGFIVQTKDRSFVLPSNTVLLPTKPLKLSANVLDIPITYETMLLAPDLKIVSVYQQETEISKKTTIQNSVSQKAQDSPRTQQVYEPVEKEFITTDTVASVVFADIQQVKTANSGRKFKGVYFLVVALLVVVLGGAVIMVVIRSQQKKPEYDIQALGGSDETS